jgi:hypothetical protein
MSYIAVAGLGVSVITSIAGGNAAKKQAEQTRAQEKQLRLAEMALNEKMASEKLRVEAEISRTNILANSLLAYRTTLQTESTQRLKDTWLYQTGTGIGLGVFYGLYLMTSKE